MEYKFKKGDRVVAVKDSSNGFFKKGDLMTVDQDNSVNPWVLLESGFIKYVNRNEIELYNPTPHVKIAVSFENDREKIAYLRYCESIGKRWAAGQKPTHYEPPFMDNESGTTKCISFDDFPNHPAGITTATPEFFKENGYSIVPFKVFASLKGIDYTPIVEVKLNDTHTAVIENGKVKVGRQTFEFERIEALYNAVKEAKK